MPCYHPFVGFRDEQEFLATGKFIYKLAGHYNPEYEKHMDPYAIKIPCGKCLGCRLDYSRSWSDRMILELLATPENKAMFLTLTYRNENLPIAYDDDTGLAFGYTLDKRDIQLFMKRLRKAFSDRTIRFYLSGEYGSWKYTHRPHYHAIVYGISMEDFPDRKPVGMNELKQVWHTSKVLENIWNNGFVSFSPVTVETCSYVSRYTLKKIKKDDNDPRNEFLVSEFSLMSRRPGIGKPYYDTMTPIRLELDHIYANDKGAQLEIKMPRYFLDRLKIDNPELYDKLGLDSRRQYYKDSELLRLQNTDLSYIEYLEQQEADRMNKTEILFKRGDI